MKGLGGELVARRGQGNKTPRMAALITMQPNINIPLYLVAPDEWQNKVDPGGQPPNVHCPLAPDERVMPVHRLLDSS